VVPHFEKMLYDNALLLGSYVRGWRRVPDHEPLLRAQCERVVRGIVGWLERELLLPSGGFASSLDADSLDSRGMQHEGIYYSWTPELLIDALGETDGAWAAEVFHVTTNGRRSLERLGDRLTGLGIGGVRRTGLAEAGRGCRRLPVA